MAVIRQRFIRAHAPSAYIVAREFKFASATAAQRAQRVMRHHGALLLMRLIRNASGHPGPQIVSGDYIDSFHVDYVGSNQWQARLRAYNTQPYSDRLEFGFTGVDSKGRYYDQPPFPHFGPAIAATFPKLQHDLADMANNLPLGWSPVGGFEKVT